MGVPDLAVFLDKQPSLEHDILAHREDALLKHGPHLAREPIVRLVAGVASATSSMPKRNSAKGERR
jgi:hypothetical protein